MKLKEWFGNWWILRVEKRLHQMEVDLSVLRSKIIAQTTVIEGIQSDYITLQAKIEELQAAIDANNPEAIQTSVDELVGLVDASNAKLVALDESVPPAETPTP